MLGPAVRRTLLTAALLAGAVGCAQTGGPDQAVVDDVLFQAAASAEQGADYVAAADHYRKLQASNPDDLNVLYALARNYRYAGAAASAVKVLQAARETHGEDKAFLMEMGKAKLAAGKTRGAIADLEQAAKRSPDSWQVHSTLGIAFDLQENYAAAQAAYDRALELSEENAAVLNNKAISLALAGDLDAAINLLKNAPRVARHNPQVRQNLALFYGLKGDTESARSLARIDLDEETVQKNLEIISKMRRN